MSAGQIEPDGPDHRRTRPGDVDTVDAEQSAHDLGEQGMDEIRRVGLVRAVGLVRGDRLAGNIVCRGRDPADEQAGDLQLSEDVCRVSVVGETGRRTGAHHALTGHAEKDMTLTGAQGREHLAGDLVGHRRGSPAQALSGHHRVLSAGHGTRGQDENGAPAPASLDQGADDAGIGRAQVRSNHRRGLGIVHSEDVSAKDAEVA